MQVINDESNDKPIFLMKKLNRIERLFSVATLDY